MELQADSFIDEYFRFIDADPTGREDVDFDLDWIIDKATDAVLRDGIRVLVIDPWNEVEHARRRDESVTDYIGRGIRALKRFARLFDVAVIVCRPSDERCWPRWESSATDALRHRGVGPLVQ